MTLANGLSRRTLLAGVLPIVLASCAGVPGTGSPPVGIQGSPTSAPPVAPSENSVAGSPSSTSSPLAEPQPPNTQAPDIGGGTTSGDVPDNAVFLTYRQTSLGFAIQYVEGWQVTTDPNGVVIHDKDSSETVNLISLP